MKLEPKKYNELYVTINCWMFKLFKKERYPICLKSIVFAVIYSFCKDEASKYFGSQEYLSILTGYTRPRISDALKSLTEDYHYIIKEEVIEETHGRTNKYCVYRINHDLINKLRSEFDNEITDEDCAQKEQGCAQKEQLCAQKEHSMCLESTVDVPTENIDCAQKEHNNQYIQYTSINNCNEDKSSTLNKDKSLNLKDTSLNNTLNNKSNDIYNNILTELNLNELSTDINDIELLINHLDLNNDLKKLMIDYFKARYKIKKSNLKQVLRKIKTVFKESNYDSDLVYETVDLAYINNYQGWEPKWILDKRANYNNRNNYKNNKHIDDDLPSSAPKPGKKSVGNATF